MPTFTDPFNQMTPGRKMTKRELVRALRLNIAAEEDATSLYEAHADATDDPLAKKVLQDIADEERVHVGEFQRLISILLADEDKWLADGAAEVNEMAAEVAAEEAARGQGATGATVGDLTEGWREYGRSILRLFSGRGKQMACRRRFRAGVEDEKPQRGFPSRRSGVSSLRF